MRISSGPLRPLRARPQASTHSPSPDVGVRPEGLFQNPSGGLGPAWEIASAAYSAAAMKRGAGELGQQEWQRRDPTLSHWFQAQ